jgi:hypothetical protein
MSTDIKYNSNLRPRGKLKQVGASIPYTYYNRPLLKRLEVYENTYKYEPVIQQATDVLIDGLLGALGPIEHPDPEIQEFCRYSISRHEDMYSVDLFVKIREIAKITLWAGFSVTEPIYEIFNSSLYLKDYVTYHPATIIIRTNKLGQLTENEESYEGPHLSSGVYQKTSIKSEAKLPLWKIALLTYNKEFNNYYGTSIVENCYRWHVLKEAYVDMMTTTIDRYGNPITFLTVPNMSSGQQSTNPITGETVTLPLHELLRQQLANMESQGQSSNYIVLPFIENNNRPQAQVLSTSSNAHTSFLEAIKYCEGQILRNLLIPFNLLEQSSTTRDSFAERQIEIYNRIINSLYRVIIVPFINQTLHRQVQYNFARKASEIPPILPLRKTARPEARVALMQMIRGLTETGYLNPSHEADWSSIREMVDALNRPMEKEDEKFVKDVLIEPRKKPTPVANNKAPATANAKKSKNKTTPRGGQEGRPTGSVAPQQESRPLTKDS